MSENYQCHITINNRTDLNLRVNQEKLAWGHYTQEPVEIPKKSEARAFVAVGAYGSPSGTEGTVIYQVGDDANVTIKIYFDVPWAPLSHNTIKVESSNPDVAVQLIGFNGSGSVESCTIKVVDGR